MADRQTTTPGIYQVRVTSTDRKVRLKVVRRLNLLVTTPEFVLTTAGQQRNKVRWTAPFKTSKALPLFLL